MRVRVCVNNREIARNFSNTGTIQGYLGCERPKKIKNVRSLTFCQVNTNLRVNYHKLTTSFYKNFEKLISLNPVRKILL